MHTYYPHIQPESTNFQVNSQLLEPAMQGQGSLSNKTSMVGVKYKLESFLKIDDGCCGVGTVIHPFSSLSFTRVSDHLVLVFSSLLRGAHDYNLIFPQKNKYL